MRAPVGAPLTYHDAPDRRSALRARLRLLAVDTKPGSELARPTIGQQVGEVVERRSAPPQPCIERRPDRPPQPAQLVGGQRTARPLRGDAGAMQRLVCVDVAQPGDDVLVEEQRLDRCGAAGEQARQVGDPREVGVGVAAETPQRRCCKLLGCVGDDEPERPRVDEPHLDTAADPHHDVGVRALRVASLGQADPAGHTEVRHPCEIAAEVGHEELAVAAEATNGAAGHPGHEVVGVVLAPHHSQASHLGGDDPAACQLGLQETPGPLDLRELRHLSRTQSPPASPQPARHASSTCRSPRPTARPRRARVR